MGVLNLRAGCSAPAGLEILEFLLLETEAGA
jgi:hypothetical protein